MPNFVGRTTAVRRRHLAQRTDAVLLVDLVVSHVTGRIPEGCEEFGVPDRHGLTPDRVAVHLATVQRVFDPSGQRLLQALKAIDLK